MLKKMLYQKLASMNTVSISDIDLGFQDSKYVKQTGTTKVEITSVICT